MAIALAPPPAIGRVTPLAAHRRTSEGPEIVLDLSRLLSRVLHPAPTGIDRVEMAYARTLLRRVPDRLRFGGMHPAGVYGRLPRAVALEFLDATEADWESGAFDPRGISALRRLWRARPRPIPPGAGPRVLVQASHQHLDRPRVIAGKLARERASLVCLLHDLIPISHPEYARPGDAERHQQRLRTIEAYAGGLLVNSNATLAALKAHSALAGDPRPIRVAHLGLTRKVDHAAQWRTDRPYFVCLGTIEPRKNHLLLLTLWRTIVQALGSSQAPALFVVGRRGWENENVLDMLDRCPALDGVVRELPSLPDTDLRPLMKGARALLMPSFAEGFGLPLAEALADGVPVIASDLPAHREVGGDAPEFIDPVDGAAWRAAILDYALPAAPRRDAQLARLRAWRAVRWDDHVATLLSVIDEVAACPAT